jgi:hypothetical protein
VLSFKDYHISPSDLLRVTNMNLLLYVANINTHIYIYIYIKDSVLWISNGGLKNYLFLKSKCISKFNRIYEHL